MQNSLVLAESLFAAMSWKSGAVIAERYRLERSLGAGGMGEVWEATHLFLDRVVAIKLLHVRSSVVRSRLLREARALARVRHPAIVEVHDSGELPDGTPFLVLERLRGETLASLLRRRGRLPAIECAHLFVTLLDGLAAAHAAGVIHRDVKSDNIFLGESPKLLDFGIARLEIDGDTQLTGAGAILGTPSYMAPEQFTGEPCDERTDVWGMTATLYEALTGAQPFGGDSVLGVMRRVLDAPLPYPRDLEGLDGRLWSVLARGLNKKPGDRFPSAGAMRDALVTWLSRSSSAPAVEVRPSEPADDEDRGPSLDRAILHNLRGD